MKRYIFRISLYLLIFYALIGVVLCEKTVHLNRNPLIESEQREAEALAHNSGATLEAVQQNSSDGLVLRAWMFRHREKENGTVLLLHGQGDNRAGMLSYAKLFLDHQYDVLDMDIRSHGESGGNLASYGLKESYDVHRWMSWLMQEQDLGCVFGLGESMGASILLESLQKEPRFCAVVAESAFSSLREMAYDRVAENFAAGTWLGKTLLRPAIEIGFLYARIGYGLNFENASPVDAVRASTTPVLLIHGADDHVISPRHSKIILQSRTQHIELWEPPRTRHTEAISNFPGEFEQKVLGFFSTNNLNRKN